MISSKGDVHSDAVVAALNFRKLSDRVVRLNTEDFLTNCTFEFDGDTAKVRIEDSQKTIDTSRPWVVWFRRPLEPEFQHSDKDIQAFTLSEANGALKSFYYLLHNEDCNWINDLRNMRNWRWKMKQLRLAKQLGLRTPKTMITNDFRMVIKSFGKDKRLCIKSLNTPIFGEEEGMQSIYTQAVEYGEIAQTDFNASFSIFQSYIDKAFDVRLCIFGDRIHAFKISTQENDLSQVDSRGFSPALLPHEEITLPEEIADKVASMMSNMGLVFSAMDFVVDRAGEWWFLENNCNGQWLWLQHVTGVDLVGGFVDLLLEKCETV